MKATPIPIHPRKAAEMLQAAASKVEALSLPYTDRNRAEAQPRLLIAPLTDLADRLPETYKKPFVGTSDWPFTLESAVHLLNKAAEANSRDCDFVFDIVLMAACELVLDVIQCAANDCGLDPSHYDSNGKGVTKLKVIK